MFKKIIITILFASLYGGIIFAAPNFELWNKTTDDIKVEIIYNNNAKRILLTRSGGRVPLSDVNMKRKMLITINDTERYYIDHCEEHGNCHRTVYLSYDRTGLRPQKGKWYGLAGITMSGYDNTKNIGEDKIHGIQLLLEE